MEGYTPTEYYSNHDNPAFQILDNFCTNNLGKKLHTQPLGSYVLEGVRFSSRSEAACGYLMEKYISDFSLKIGQTFEVPVGVGSGGDLQTVDFRYQDIYLEYHPPRIYSEKYCAHKYRASCRNKKGRNAKQARSEYLNKLRRKLTYRYLEERMDILSNSIVVDNFKLVVATSPAEFFHDFLKLYADKSLPTFKRFLELFYFLQKQVVVDSY